MKLCIIGQRGHIGYVFQSIADVPQVDLTAISTGCDDTPGKLQTLSAQAGFSPEFYQCWQTMLDEQKPDIVAIDGPFELHAAMSAYALKRGIHVFCEKPVALTLEDLEMVDAARRESGAHILSMIGLRYAGAFYHALKLVRSGAIGKVKLIRAQKSYKLGSRPEFYRHHDTYGGTIPWVGSHAFDWIMAFSGSTMDKVWATQTKSDNFDHGDLEIACQCMMTMKNGVQASLTIDYLRSAAAPTHGDDRVRVAGTNGIIEVASKKITLIDADGLREIPVPEPERKIFADFVNSLCGKSERWVSDEETIELTRACLRARDAALNI